MIFDLRCKILVIKTDEFCSKIFKHLQMKIKPCSIQSKTQKKLSLKYVTLTNQTKRKFVLFALMSK